MMKIYLAAPLFNDMERERNTSFSDMLENNGFDVYLPQRDGGLFYDLVSDGCSYEEARNRIFIEDTKAINESDIILCLLDGRVLDEGMCIELGIAYAQRKICVGYKTDQRSQDKFGNNIILDGVISNIFSCKDDLLDFLLSIRVKQKLVYVQTERLKFNSISASMSSESGFNSKPNLPTYLGDNQIL